MTKLYKRAKNDPIFFVENVIGNTKLWAKQRIIMESVRDNLYTAVRSCNGAGKTFTSASVVAWFLSVHPDSIVVTTAPTARQVEELLWAEIRRLHSKSKYPLGGDPTMTTWRISEKWFALGLSTKEPDRFQGFHSDNILCVIDEAAGVEAVIWEAVMAILTSRNAHLLVIGNPTESSGEFYNAFSSELYNKIHISAFETPNFTKFGITSDDIANDTWEEKITGPLPYDALVTPKWVRQRYLEWGEDSPMYQARIQGNFPTIGDDMMIPLSWLLRATESQPKRGKDDKIYMSVDVARFGTDESVVAWRTGYHLEGYQTYHGIDTYELAKHVKLKADELNPVEIIIDTVGVGGGVADVLHGWDYPIREFVSQSKAILDTRYVNRRTEIWHNMRELLRKDKVSMPREEKLLNQLISVKYKYDSAGRYKLESKDDLRDRGVDSPDRADAVVMLYSDAEPIQQEDVKSDLNRIKPNSVADIKRRLRGEETSPWEETYG